MITQINNRINLQPIDVSRANESVKEAQLALDRARKIVITTKEQYQIAVSELKLVKQQGEEKELERKSFTDPLNKVIKMIMDVYRPASEFYLEAERIIKRAMITYTDEQEKIRLELERKYQEEAKRAEDKRKKELEEQAQRWEEKGNVEKAEEKRQMAEEVFVPAPVVPTLFVKASNESFREIWKFRIVDESIIPREFLIVDEKLLGATARNTKGKFKIPGVEFYSEKTVAV